MKYLLALIPLLLVGCAATPPATTQPTQTIQQTAQQQLDAIENVNNFIYPILTALNQGGVINAKTFATIQKAENDFNTADAVLKSTVLSGQPLTASTALADINAALAVLAQAHATGVKNATTQPSSMLNTRSYWVLPAESHFAGRNGRLDANYTNGSSCVGC